MQNLWPFTHKRSYPQAGRASTIFLPRDHASGLIQCVMKFGRFKSQKSASANKAQRTTDSRVKNRICF
jgi:hypothetical protein